MARIPTLTNNALGVNQLGTARPDAPRTPFQTVRADPGAFGAIQGQQLKELGAAVKSFEQALSSGGRRGPTQGGTESRASGPAGPTDAELAAQDSKNIIQLTKGLNRLAVNQADFFNGFEFSAELDDETVDGRFSTFDAEVDDIVPTIAPSLQPLFRQLAEEQRNNLAESAIGIQASATSQQGLETLFEGNHILVERAIQNPGNLPFFAAQMAQNIQLGQAAGFFNENEFAERNLQRRDALQIARGVIEQNPDDVSLLLEAPYFDVLTDGERRDLRDEATGAIERQAIRAEMVVARENADIHEEFFQRAVDGNLPLHEVDRCVTEGRCGPQIADKLRRVVQKSSGNEVVQPALSNSIQAVGIAANGRPAGEFQDFSEQLAQLTNAEISNIPTTSAFEPGDANLLIVSDGFRRVFGSGTFRRLNSEEYASIFGIETDSVSQNANVFTDGDGNFAFFDEGGLLNSISREGAAEILGLDIGGLPPDQNISGQIIRRLEAGSSDHIRFAEFRHNSENRDPAQAQFVVVNDSFGVAVPRSTFRALSRNEFRSRFGIARSEVPENVNLFVNDQGALAFFGPRGLMRAISEPDAARLLGLDPAELSENLDGPGNLVRAEEFTNPVQPTATRPEPLPTEVATKDFHDLGAPTLGLKDPALLAATNFVRANLIEGRIDVLSELRTDGPVDINRLTADLSNKTVVDPEQRMHIVSTRIADQIIRDSTDRGGRLEDPHPFVRTFGREAVAGMTRIAIPWGRPGTRESNFEDGSGLSNAIVKMAARGNSLDEILKFIQVELPVMLVGASHVKGTIGDRRNEQGHFFDAEGDPGLMLFMPRSQNPGVQVLAEPEFARRGGEAGLILVVREIVFPE